MSNKTLMGTTSLSAFGDLLNVADLAEFLGVSKRTIYRLVDSGELPTVQVGRRLYFPRHKLAAKFDLEALYD